MRKLLGLVLLFAVTMPLAHAQVYVDYDETAAFGDYKTFAWVSTPDVSLADTSPLMDSRIKNSIEHHLTAGGMIEDTQNPDLFVTYHGEEKQELRVDTVPYGYRPALGYRYDPFWGRPQQTTVRTYTKGTLIIDIWLASEKQLIWRGTITGAVSENPERQAKKIEKSINKLVKKWKKIRAKQR